MNIKRMFTWVFAHLTKTALFIATLLTAVASARAADFAPMSETEVAMFYRSKVVSVPQHQNQDAALASLLAFRTPPAENCDAASAELRCAETLYLVLSLDEAVSAYGVKTEPGFAWKVESIADQARTPPAFASPLCTLVTFSEEVRDGTKLSDGSLQRRTSQVCLDISGLKLQGRFKASVTPLTAWETTIARGAVHQQQYRNRSPWEITIYQAGDDECSTETGVACKIYTAFAFVKDRDTGQEFAFHAPMSFPWRVTDIKTLVREDSSPRCALFTFEEEVRSSSRSAPWPKREHHVCAAPSGFVEVK